jgi:hypothetical protein
MNAEHIEHLTRHRALTMLVLAGRVDLGTTTEKQISDAQDLAVDLYETAERHGLTPVDADAVTSFIQAAIDGIRARDRAAQTRRDRA